MTLLETLYRHLKHNELTSSAEHFSVTYLNKSKSWYAVQMHERREISAAAAIQCLRTIRATQANGAFASDQQRVALSAAAHLLAHHLARQHAVAEVA